MTVGDSFVPGIADWLATERNEGHKRYTPAYHNDSGNSRYNGYGTDWKHTVIEKQKRELSSCDR